LCGEPCVPDCTNRECGDDGCDGSCGECDPALECSAGLCVEPGSAPDSDGPIQLDAWSDDAALQKDAPWTEPGEIETEASYIPGNECPEGKILRYGKCVPKDEAPSGEKPSDGDASGGCSANTAPSPAGAALLLLLVTTLWVNRRRGRARYRMPTDMVL
jgi:hypothetical protein